MNIFLILFFTGIGFYFIAALAALIFSSNRYSDRISLVFSLIASGIMISASIVEAVVYKFEYTEINILADVFSPLEINIAFDSLNIIFLAAAAISAAVVSIYIYSLSVRREINVSYYKSSFLANLFMAVLSLLIGANQGYFLTMLIGLNVLIVFVMLVSDFENRTEAKKAVTFLITGNIAVMIITVAYALIVSNCGLFTVNGFEASLLPYPERNITFTMLMAGIFILLFFVPVSNHKHINLLINGLFSKILLLVMFRFIVNLYAGTVSIIPILIFLSAAIFLTGFFSVKASLTIDGKEWLRYVDISLNFLCMVSIIFCLYASNLGYSLIADQIRISTAVMIICSIVLYPAISVIINSMISIDKSKRFKGIALIIFIAKSLLPPMGGFAGIFIIISNISGILDLTNFLKTVILLFFVSAFVYMYLLYIYSHMKFYINAIDEGYEPSAEKVRRKLSVTNLCIILFSLVLTFVTGFIPTLIGYGIAMVYSAKGILMIAGNIVIMLVLTYFLNFTQVNTTFRMFSPSELKNMVKNTGAYHSFLKLVSFIFLIIAGTFFSISNVMIVDGVKSYSVLGVMYIIVSIFMLYDKDIDFQDLYVELYMTIAIIVNAVTPPVLIIKLLMGAVGILAVSFAIFRQRVKIRDIYDRTLANGKIYLYIAFFLTYFADFTFPFDGMLWGYILHVVIGLILFVLVYIIASVLSVNIFQKRGKRRVRKNEE